MGQKVLMFTSPFIIVDASVVLKWYLKEEHIDVAQRMLDRMLDGSMTLLQSPLLALEVINSLRSAILSKRLLQEEALWAVEDFFALEMHRLEPFTNDEYQRMLTLSLQHTISMYDASYLVSAQRMNCHVYTADRKLYNKTNGAVDYIRWIEEFS